MIDPRVAACLAPVLITGETGTGKDVAARAVHELTAASMRRPGAFVAVNCAALPESLAESELFGHAKGAFTGAEARVGAFVFADKGTLFLDEIGDAPRMLQAKLLRALDSGSVTPVGNSRPIPVTCRIVCATNVDLGAAVASGAFRADLLHRIDVLRVRVPPLRERADFDDVARSVLVRVNAECGTSLHVDDWSALRAYSWPGNVRELRNALTRMATGQDAGIVDQCQSGDQNIQVLRTVADLERAQRDMVTRALAEAGSIAGAARMIGVNRTTLTEWLKRGGWKRRSADVLLRHGDVAADA